MERSHTLDPHQDAKINLKSLTSYKKSFVRNQGDLLLLLFVPPLSPHLYLTSGHNVSLLCTNKVVLAASDLASGQNYTHLLLLLHSVTDKSYYHIYEKLLRSQ